MSVHDPVLTAAPDLLGPDAGDMLAAALDGIAEVERWWRSQTRHVPGRQLVVRYGVDVTWPDGRRSTETMVAETSTDPAPADVLVLEAPSGGVVWLWRYPFDPHLPGLTPAAHPHRVRELLDRLGVPPGEVQLRPRAYRASRRAVLEVLRGGDDDGAHRFYLKVLPPRRTRRIHDVHLAVARAIPAPLPLAVDLEAGTLLLSEVPGPSLRELLVDPTVPLPPAEAIVDLQHRLAAVDTGVTAVPPRPFGVQRGADSLCALLPEHTGLIRAIARGAEAAVASDDPVVTIHGDLHEAQIIVGADGTLGLVDLDGTGPGALLDDAATTLAHLVVLGRWHPPTMSRTDAYAADYTRAVAAVVDPSRVRHRAAGVMIGLAAGAFTAADRRWREECLGRLALAAELADIDPEDLGAAVADEALSAAAET